MTSNKELKKVYDEATLDWHSGYNESMEILKIIPSWQGLKVLEIGCGPGHLASMLAYAGADVAAIDYSDKQIKRATQNYNTKRIKFKCQEYDKVKGKFAVIIMQGVLEHLDKPEKSLKLISDRLLAEIPGAKIIISLPHFWNPRGFVFNTLRLLYNAPMSLTDKHYFLPGEVKSMIGNIGMQITDYRITDESWGSGEECILDLEKRIPAACPDIPLENVKSFLKWLKMALTDGTVDYRNSGLGATAVYCLERMI